MVSYYNSLAMFPQPGRPAPPPANTTALGYPAYSAYSQYPGHPDQNSNLQLYAGFTPEFGQPG